MKFGPAIQNFKGGKENKLVSKDIHSLLKHYFFRDLDNIPDVPSNVNFTTMSDDKHIRIKINTRDYVNYQDFNGLNVNYFLSDFNEIGDIDQTYGFVTKVSQTYGAMGSQVEYELVLDTGHTFYDYFFNAKGNYEVVQMHNDRGIEDKDGNNVPDLMNTPFIENCDEICNRFDNKHELVSPQLLIDSKHFDYTLTPRENNDFINISGTTVSKQLRGIVVVGASPNESGTIISSLIEKVAIGLKLFMYPIYDDFNISAYDAGIKGIQVSYRIDDCTIIGDILDLSQLSPADGTGGYLSTTNTFKTSITNLMINKNDFDKLGYTPEEIRKEIIEPHLNAITHTEYNITTIGKQAIKFNLNQFFGNLANIQKPSETNIIEQPLFEINDALAAYIKKYGQLPIPQFYMQFDGKPYAIFNVFINSFELGFMKIDMVFQRMQFDPTNDLITFGKNFNTEEYSGTGNITNKPTLYDETAQAYVSGIFAISSETKNKNVYNVSEAYVSSTLQINFSFSDKPTTYATTYNHDKSIFTYLSTNDIAKPGTPNNNVVGYDIFNYNNLNKYEATQGYILIDNKLYKFPIGQYTPKNISAGAGEYFGYDDKVIILTKQIGFFTPEEVGLKNILLNTDTTTLEKIDNSKMILSVQGVYNYPYYTEAYLEFMKNNKNQFNAGYANINATLKARQASAGAMLGGNVINGIANTGGGGPLNRARGITEIAAGVGQGIAQIGSAQTEAENARRSLTAKINDAKNMADNTMVTGSTSTITDTVLKQYNTGTNRYTGYGNFGLPVLHKLEVSRADKETIARYYNKYGYQQDKIYQFNSMRDLMTRGAFNRIKITNADHLFLQSGISEWLAADVISDFTHGVGLGDADKVTYDQLLDFTINNYEVKFYIPPEEKQRQLDRTLEGDL